MRAEHTAVDVRLVDHHDAEVVEDVAPPVVVRKNTDMEHVGVREDHVRAPPDVPPPLDGRVAVVDRGTQVRKPEPREPPCLILRERLRRVEVERTHRGLPRDRVEHGERERKRLPRRRPGRDDDALAARDCLPRLGLVVVEAGHPAGGERARHIGVEVRRERCRAPTPRGLGAAVHDLGRVEKPVAVGRGGQGSASASARSTAWA